MSSLENWKKSQHCSFFTSFVLDIYISQYEKLTLKTVGFCAHWIGSGVKGEQVQRGRGTASVGQAAGAKGRMRVFTIALEEGKRGSQKCKSGREGCESASL